MMSGYQAATFIMELLEGAGWSARLAGGCVRDRLMQRAPHDYDVATTALPQMVLKHLGDRGVKVIPTGIEHGTVTAVVDGCPIEVTTLRRDVATDGRRAVVAFANSFEEDAARRDFTVNAMYEDRNGQVFDYFGGRQDLHDRRLRFVGDPAMRIREDYLRILRFFRFWSQLALYPDAQALKVIPELASGLHHISQERITSEALRILSGSSQTLREVLPALQQTGVWHYLSRASLASLALQQAIAATALPRDAGLLRLAAITALGMQAPADAMNEAKRLRLSTAETHAFRVVAQLFQHLNKLAQTDLDKVSTGENLIFIDEVEQGTGPGSFLELLNPLVATLVQHDSERHHWRRPLAVLREAEEKFGERRRQRLPISGKDLIRAFKLPAGPKLGQLLHSLKVSFYDGCWQTVEEGLAFAAAQQNLDTP